MAKTESILFRVEPEIKEWAAAKAAEEGRSLSNYLETLIRREMKKRQGGLTHDSERGL